MRGAALIFGLLGGVLGAGVIAFGNLESGLAASPVLAGHDALIAKFVLYLIPNLGLLGAGLALVRPKLGGVLMLLCALAWLGVAILAGHGAVLFAALPFTFVAAGALVAFSARRGEASHDLALVEPAPGDWQDEEPDEDEGLPAYAPAPRGLRGRSEPEFGRVASHRAAPVASSRYAEEEPEEEDFVDAEEAIDAEEDAEPEDEPYVEDDEAVAEDGESEDEGEDGQPEGADDDEAVPSPSTPASSRGRQSQWSLPHPEQSPAPPRTRQRHVPEQHRPPSRREPAPTPPKAQIPDRRPAHDFDMEDEDFTPGRRDFQPRPRNAYREFDPYDPRDAQPRRRGALGGMLRGLMVILLVLVVGGIAGAVYFYERGDMANLLVGRHVAAETGAPAAAAPKPAAPKPAAPDTAATAGPIAAPAAPLATPEPAAAASAAPAAAAAAASSQPSPTSSAAEASNSPTYADIFAYCRAVGTADVPDSQYTGPAMPDAVVKALGPAAAADQLHWRCANQTVLACNANHGAACDLTPTVDTMISYCADHPDEKQILAPNGFWSCNGKRPVIPRDQKWPVDARGFYPGAWKQVAPPAAG
ncbi:MAG: hypothetical protein P4M09_30715 [Devosia sp.]|nr:hypothetical protein [Devosia sp.]